MQDKWRNMSVSSVGSTSRERVRTPVLGHDRTMNGGPSVVVEGLDLNLTESGVGSSSTERVGTVLGLDLNLSICSAEPSSVFPLVVYGGTPEPCSVRPLVAYGGTPEPSSVRPLVPYGGTPEPSSVLPLVPYVGTPEPSRSTVDRRADPEYVFYP